MNKEQEIKEEKQKEEEEKEARIESWLIDYGLEPEEARRILKEALIKYGKRADSTLIMKYAFQLANKDTLADSKPKKSRKENKNINSLPEDSLITNTQKSRNASRKELLTQTGIIKDSSEFN